MISVLIKSFKGECIDFQKGRWLDVKDTIDQWLEAVIIDLDPDNKTICVHYNGWGPRWDEWIPFNSKRIAPFRTFTIQTPQNAYLTPSPNIPTDYNFNLSDSINLLQETSKVKNNYKQ